MSRFLGFGGQCSGQPINSVITDGVIVSAGPVCMWEAVLCMCLCMHVLVYVCVHVHLLVCVPVCYTINTTTCMNMFYLHRMNMKLAGT